MFKPFIRIFGILLIWYTPATFAESGSACGDDMLSLVNRPSIANSVCPIPPHHMAIEAGYIYATLVAGGAANTYPMTQLRFGLPKTTEFYVYLPNHIQKQTLPFSGNTAVSTGFKHQFLAQNKLDVSMDARVIHPSGSYYYGTQSVGGILSAIVNYALTEQLNILGMFSMAYQGQAASNPNQQWFAFSPDVVLSLALTPRLSFYTEIYGLNRVSPLLGSGYNIDGGLVFAVSKYMTLDIETSHRLTGVLGGFEAYIGAGGAVLFDKV